MISRPKKAKIFLGFKEIAGYCHSLRDGFDNLGYNCTFMNTHAHPYDYLDDKGRINYLVDLFLFVENKRKESYKSQLFLNRYFLHYFAKVMRFLLFLWAIISFDVFIFVSHSTFFGNKMDLPILKFFRKKIIFVFLGSDARPPYINGFKIAQIGKSNIEWYIRSTRQKKQNLCFVEKYSDHIINIPSINYFHEMPFINFFAIGFPKSISTNFLSNSNYSSGKTIKILHSPSNLQGKGTDIIREIIIKMQNKGYGIEFVELTNQPNAVVLESLLSCDFVVDQLYSDTPLAGFATEAAFFGKPAVVGGYYADYIWNDVPLDYIPPSEYVHPGNLEQAIEKLIVNEKYREKLGKKARHFAESYLKPELVATRYLRLINDDAPDEWYCDPNTIQYLHGAGLSEQHGKEMVASMIREGGLKSLCLEDKPELEKLFLEFSKHSNRQKN